MDEAQASRMQTLVEESLREVGARVISLNAGEFRAVLHEYAKRAPSGTSEAVLLNWLRMHYVAASAASESRNVGSPPADWRIH